MNWFYNLKIRTKLMVSFLMILMEKLFRVSIIQCVCQSFKHRGK